MNGLLCEGVLKKHDRVEKIIGIYKISFLALAHHGYILCLFICVWSEDGWRDKRCFQRGETHTAFGSYKETNIQDTTTMGKANKGSKGKIHQEWKQWKHRENIMNCTNWFRGIISGCCGLPYRVNNSYTHWDLMLGKVWLVPGISWLLHSKSVLGSLDPLLRIF